MRASVYAGFLLAVVLFCCPVHARVLYGEVGHSDSVAPVEKNLLPGDVFNHDKLPAKGDTKLNDWYRIPGWLAGLWHKETQTDYYRYSYATNETDNTQHERIARSDGRWGTQKDSQGNIWQYEPVPYEEMIDAGDETVVQIVRSCEPIQVSDKVFGKRSIDTQLRVDKATGKIKSVETGEEITYLTPESTVLLKRETSAKVFDKDGKAILLGKSFSYENRLSDFEPQNSYHGKDMRVLFNEFLKAVSAHRMIGTNVCFLRPLGK
jgi:hypothetical protein